MAYYVKIVSDVWGRKTAAPQIHLSLQGSQRLRFISPNLILNASILGGEANEYGQIFSIMSLFSLSILMFLVHHHKQHFLKQSLFCDTDVFPLMYTHV